MAKPNRVSKGAKHAHLTLAQAQRLTQKKPQDAQAWKQYGGLLLNQNSVLEAISALENAREWGENDANIHSLLGVCYHRRSRISDAKAALDEALALDVEHVQALVTYGIIEREAGRNEKALSYLERAEKVAPQNGSLLENKAASMVAQARYDEASSIYEYLIQQQPKNYSYWNGAANVRRDLGDFDGLDDYYQKAIALAGETPIPFSNRLTFIHYDPDWSREAIFHVCDEWQQRFAPKQPPERPVPSDLSTTRKLRIGMFSDGFRNHPVGTMIIEAMAATNPDEMEFYLYPTHSEQDHITERMKRIVAKWQPIKHLSNDEFTQLIKEDQIDILVDLAGHNSGTRSKAVAMQPAPLIVKWVGGLINTTGVHAIDYLISDAIETPLVEGEDDFYTEKLIRLPDDYIVFSPPKHAPPCRSLPALENGYITLGCFNNPTKLNKVLLSEWATLMHELPGSRLFLKGKPYTSESFCERIYTQMENHGIERDRLMIEGPASHRGLMDAYNRVDIALDPWPYSGGLTTCEALLMGVPVVTLPGPTFAGRHSASHLVNAGMPELVVDNWDEYRDRVTELAGDLESLSTIRRSLRQVMLQSPMCDGRRFAKHFMLAMRAIWQRYCEDKAPEALTFNKDSQLWFEDDQQLLDISVEEKPVAAPTGFQWELKGKVMVLDNSAKLVRSRALVPLLSLNAFAIVAFDPASRVPSPQRFEGREDLQLFPHAVLGDGQSGTLYACVSPSMSGTLKPLPEQALPPHTRQDAKIITQLPIHTIALNSIEGLESLDWLILDELSDADTILANGKEALKDTLLIEARLAFQPTYERQPTLAELQHWSSRNGFRFYRLERLGHRSHFPARDDLKKKQSSELISADALFLPSYERMAELTDNQRIKLAFLLHTIYGIRDMSYELLAAVDEEKAEEYLIAEGVVEDAAKEVPAVETPEPSAVEKPETPAHEAQEFPVPEAPFMSPAERSLFKKGLKNAKHYFEFGSGGSTVWAVKEGLTVKGVESDAKWVNALKNKLGEKCEVEAVDIGPTKEWGFPVSIQQASRFPAYSKAIHHHAQEFDFILVDGRFRVACAMAAIQHVLEHSKEPQEARIFIHDFWDRPQYHTVLEFLDVVEKAETAGVFKLKRDLKAEAISEAWGKFSLQPN